MRRVIPLLVVMALAAAVAAEELPLNVVRAPGAVTIDGKLDEWVLSAPVSYEVDPSSFDRCARTWAMWDDQSLYVAWAVKDSSPLKNGGDDPSRAFKTGDSLHVYLSTAAEVAGSRAEGGPEDYHVVLAMLGGQPRVFAFRQKKAGVDKPAVLSSPATRIEMDWMGPVPGAELATVVTGGQGYTAEVRLPLAFFDGFAPKAGQSVGADVAVNFSDPGGTSNLAKVWWHRGSSQILDLPTELRFERNLWGTAIFRGPGERPLVINNQNFFVVPAPGAVAVDGDLGDWDLSCAYGPQYVDASLKDKYNVTWVAMYDQEALYLGAVFNSGMPFVNNGGVDNTWWLGDSLEFRVSADPTKLTVGPRENMDILTFALWHNPGEQKDYIALQRSFQFQIGEVSQFAVKSKAAAGGRVFEARIPWSVVQSGRRPQAGEQVPWTMAGIWRNGVRAFGMGSLSSYRGMGDWGQAHFLAQGKQQLVFRDLPLPPGTGEGPVEGGSQLVTLEAPVAGALSAGVYDQAGKLLRTLCAGKPVEAGKVELRWDGMSEEGKPIAPGSYPVRAVINSGMKALYATSACSPGQPPHASGDPRGGWGGVWGNVVDMASDARGVYAIWAIEEGDGLLLQVNEEGRVQWRQHSPLALHGVQTAVASNGKYVYAAVDVTAQEGRKAGLWRVRAEDGGYVPFPHEGADPLAFFLAGVSAPSGGGATVGEAGTVAASVSGLAASAERVYVAAYHQDRVLALDAETGELRRGYVVPNPRGLSLDGKGGLLVVSRRQVVRVDLYSGAVKPVVTRELSDPWDVAVDGKGGVLVTDRGASQQVKRFDAVGRLVGSFGKAGGRPSSGKFEVTSLRLPAGITVAASGKVFYSEDTPPRIFARLSSGLKYEKLWSGPWYLSGEVCVDPREPEHVYMWSHEAFIRHVVDYGKRTSRPDAVWGDFALPRGQYGRWFPRIVYHEGKRYMFCGGNPDSLYRIEGDRCWLVAAMGAERQGSQPPTPWVFTDLNQNGKIDEGEKKTWPGSVEAYHGSYFGGSIDERDLGIYALSWGPNRVFVLTPTFTKEGVPVYSFDTARVIPLAAAEKAGKQVGFSTIWPTGDGGIVGNADVQGSDPRGLGHSSHLSDVYVYRLDREGKLVWRAGKKASGLAKPGEFYGRACGLGGPIGEEYFDFVDENGQDKLFTLDGLFVGNLLDDPAVAEPSEYTLLVEHFNSVVFRNAKNGKWYFTAGASGYASIWEIAGLDQVKRLTGEAKVQ